MKNSSLPQTYGEQNDLQEDWKEVGLSTAVWWIRRDLRLSDNMALSTALEKADQILPVFVLDPALLNSPYSSVQRLAFLFDGLRALDADLRQRGSCLVVRQGNPLEVLQALMTETGAHSITAEADYSPHARRRDQAIQQILPLHLTAGLTVHAPQAIVKRDGTSYTVFTPFSKAWLAQPLTRFPLPAPNSIPTPAGVQTEEIPTGPKQPGEPVFPAGEYSAQKRLAAFSQQAIHRYAQDRNRMDLNGTSSLSPYLRFGMISARQAVEAARKAESLAVDETSRRGAETWLTELIWREFYLSILYHFPLVRKTAFRAEYRSLPWNNDPDDFSAWTQGRTGYPVVDAAMRQLLATGWMHNRARMIAASFLVKDLLVDWRWGERFFMQHLIDGDPAANNGGWQWVAGTGTDAAPYFRVFNPILQGKKFDPDGDYIRRWVPELAPVPADYIHTPWELPAELQTKTGVQIGTTYPAPIIDHAAARFRALAVYRRESEVLRATKKETNA